MILVIGSAALHMYDSTVELKDFDAIATYESAIGYLKNLKEEGRVHSFYPVDDGKKIHAFGENYIGEIEIAWEGSSGADLLEFYKDHPVDVQCRGGEFIYADLNTLYALKMSHRFLRNSPHFLKTMKDTKKMRKMGAYIPEEMQEWFKKREKETYWYDHPDLTVSKKEFFKPEEVQYVYDHDDIHEVLAIADRPAYTYFIADGEQVKCDRSKFESLSYNQRLNAVIEESMVLAIERAQVPFDFEPDSEKSFRTALMKVCTSITSGWFREFAWENYDRAADRYCRLNLHNYVDKFKEALDNGQVRTFEEGMK